MKDAVRTQHNHVLSSSHKDDAEMTVYSWELPSGYDYTAESADPMADCINLSHKVHYILMNSDPAATQESESDAFRPGAVHFQSLHPGEYSLDGDEIHEQPTDQIFWECFGFDERAPRSVAVNDHHELAFSIHGGEHILCHRFHIPHTKP